jgi:hypothetical protein
MTITQFGNDLDLKSGTFSLDDKLYSEQIQFVGRCLSDLIKRLNSGTRSYYSRPVSWPEFHIFIQASYSCGFVCCDADEYMDFGVRMHIPRVIEALTRDPEKVETLTLRQIRQVMHFILRSERWGDQGADTGGSAVWGLITSPLGNAIARKLGA